MPRPIQEILTNIITLWDGILLVAKVVKTKPQAEVYNKALDWAEELSEELEQAVILKYPELAGGILNYVNSNNVTVLRHRESSENLDRLHARMIDNLEQQNAILKFENYILKEK